MKRFESGRNFMKSTSSDFESDQDKKLPQPPLFHERKREIVVPLPKDFTSLHLKDNLFELLDARKSRRLYEEKGITLLELSFLLWCAQGIKGRRGKSYATLRTVPSGGARHGFECYLAARNVEGLKRGIYHYLAGEHALEFIKEFSDEELFKSLEEQAWAVKSDVVFFMTAVCYRFEWRYDIFSHHIALIDLGHIGQSFYLGAEALKLGTCGIGAYEQTLSDSLLDVDGEEEFTVYAQAVGTLTDREKSEEKAFYQFVIDEGR
ncbi:SagB/ThcOx family dehydrogenase [Guggenheimella bovis]